MEAAARFCPSCGTPAATACASCGAALALGARFCASCGTPVAAAATADGGEPSAESNRERKVATLLFADLVGFTSLNEAHDPEVIEAIVRRAFDRLSAEVTRYEGLVEKFAGDAMLAVFGVPTVHEDDAERAVRAAVEMQQALGELRAELEREGRPGLELRIGIETGEVLADRARASNERDRIVTGDAVNTAARLEQAATPGTIVVGPGAYAATRDVIEYAELDPIVLKGKATPVPAWRAVRVKAGRGGRRAVLGLEAPLIGRDEELTLLKETVRRTVAEGRPHLVTVLGSAGVGKSRITWELEKYLDGLPETYHWRKGRCLAYAQTSYSALADAIGADASVMDDDSTEAVEAKVGARLEDLAAGTAADGIEAGVRVVLGLQQAGRLGRDELFEAWRGYLELIARRAPLVIVLEDIHWADEGLLDFIEFLGRWGDGPIAILCLARHELLERRPAWAGGLPNATSIVLEPLDHEESGRLVAALLGGALPAVLLDRVVDVAEGNPLFAEELIRLFVDRGVVRRTEHGWEQALPVAEIEIPQSIQALLAARLDSLPSEEKQLSQDAAVVGRIFWDRLLAHLAGQTPTATVGMLRSLRVKELVVPREPSSLTDAQEYAFRHVLIRDVAYDSLPKLERARKHREVAAWAEERLGDRADEVVELLAAHYWSALRYEEEFATGESDALDDLRRRTLDYARAAGHRALDVGQLESATQWMRIVVEQSVRLGTPIDEHAELVLDYLRVGELYETYEARIRAVTAAVERLLAIDDPTEIQRLLLARLRQWEAYLLYSGYNEPFERVREVITAGLTAIEGIGPCRERAALLHRLGWISWRAGPASEASPILEQALEEARASGSARLERWSLHDLGLARNRGRMEPEGLVMMERSMELAREAGDVSLLMRCYINVGSVVLSYGDTQRAMALWEEGLERALRSSDRHSTFWIANNYAQTLAELGRLAEAEPMHRVAIDAADAIGIARAGMPELAWTQIQMGRFAEGLATWEAAKKSEEAPEPQMLGQWFMLDALSAFERDPSEAVETLREGAETATRAEVFDQVGAVCFLLLRIALRLDDHDAAAYAHERIAGAVARWRSTHREAFIAWFEALARRSREDPGRIAAVAEEMLTLGRRLNAADAFADADLLARRLGVANSDRVGWAERAAELYAACGAVPVLDVLQPQLTEGLADPRP